MHICVNVLRSHHLVSMVSIVRVENTMNYGRSGPRVLLQVGCQVGGDYGATSTNW
jgi:hypothetical protein